MSEHLVGDLLIPSDLDELPILSFRKKEFKAPRTIDLRDYCVKTQDQKDKPWCAAYAACGFASNILWRKNDYPEIFDPTPIYKYAKSIDGQPDEDGTSLTAVLKGLLEYKYFDESICSIKVLRNTEQVRYAIHKFGCCLVGLMVSKEWYQCNPKKSTISGKTGKTILGGHAVLACGYNDDGVIIQNQWGIGWGKYGFALITWAEFSREFVYGAVLNNCLTDFRI